MTPHDPALPHLATALDGAAMAAVLGVRRCAVDRVKYRPGRNATVSYRVTGDDGAEHFVAARWCSGGDALRRWQRQPAGRAQHRADLDMLAWWWPADAKLRAPAVLADEARLRREALPAVLQGAALQALDVAIVQYVPESRVTARVQLHTDRGLQTVYAKSSREPATEAAHRLLQALQGRPGLTVPRPLAWHGAHDLHWQQGMPGIAWQDLPAATARRLAPALGAQVAALHAVPLALPRVLDTAALHARLAEVLPVLAAALPASQPLLARLAPRLAAGIARHAEGPACTLHGDLHARNVLADGDALALIDLDGLRRGPALLELAAWRADALYRAALEGTPVDDDAWHALLHGYAAGGGLLPGRDAAGWGVAWALVTQRAWRCVVNLKPGRFALAPTLLARAEAALEGTP